MIEILCLLVVVGSGVIGLTLWACVLLAGTADVRMDERFRTQPFFAEELENFG